MTTIADLGNTIPVEQNNAQGDDVFAYFFVNFHPNDDITAIMRQRQQFGMAKYGQTLLTGDGRHTFTEIVGEQADALIYTTKKLMEYRHEPAVAAAIKLLITDTYMLMVRTVDLYKQLEVQP